MVVLNLKNSGFALVSKVKPIFEARSTEVRGMNGVLLQAAYKPLAI